MKNQLIINILNNIADILDLQEVKFKPQAYRRVAVSISALQEPIEKIYARGELYGVRGVGKHIGLKIEEIIKTGKLKYYQKLKKQTKIDIEALGAIPFLGPKKIKTLYQKLGVKNIKDLKKSIKAKKIRELSGFGEKTELQIKNNIKYAKTQKNRFPYALALPIADNFKTELLKYKFVERIEIAGSFRRRKATIGDLDLLIQSKQPLKVMEEFVNLSNVKNVIVTGKTKTSVRLKNGLQVDLRVVNKKEFGAALLYFTGSKDHNVALRKIALKKGWTLNEYEMKELKTGKWVAGKTEKEIYRKLGLTYIEPRER
jgi:DNA polymerase (family X)